MNTTRSQALYRRAITLLPGGVNSPVRAFRAVGKTPLFLARGKGAKVWDVDGHAYLDFVTSWGPLIFGHAHPTVVTAVTGAARLGTSFGAPTAREVELAQLIHRVYPSIEMVRLVNSGTEAAMSAIRLARGTTGRSLIVKFEGCYHGHADSLLVAAGSGAMTLGVPTSAGIPPEVVRHTLVLPYNDLGACEKVFSQHGPEIACVIVEPVAGNMGVVPPAPGFLEGLRRLTTEAGALLVFDEVITGFRVALGGAQALYGVRPDLTCLGKIIGGGLPVGAYGGRRAVMQQVAPLGPVYQAGTLSGNPLAVAAGIATVSRLIQSPRGIYRRLEASARLLADGLLKAGRQAGVPVVINRVGSMLSLFFTGTPVTDYTSAIRSDVATYSRFFWAMLEEGIYLPPSQFEALFLSTAHTERDLARAVTAAARVFQRISRRTT